MVSPREGERGVRTAISRWLAGAVGKPIRLGASSRDRVRHVLLPLLGAFVAMASLMFVSSADAAGTGAISGKVTSASTKAAIEGIEVCVLESETCTSTNASGTYTLSGLSPGNYKVAFFAPEGGAYLTQFYDGKFSFSEADAVPVQAGQTKSEIDAAMLAGTNYTWSGEGAHEQEHWSNSANWGSHTAPPASSSIGTLEFPKLTSSECTTEPVTHPCYSSINDISGLKVNELVLGGPYSLSGERITLDAGREVSLIARPAQILLTLPIELGAAQTWFIEGPAEADETVSGVFLGGGLTGESHALTVDTNGGAGVDLSSKAEVGAVALTGAQPSDTGDLAADNGGVELAPGGSLNSSDGNPITLNDDVLAGDGETGPIKSLGGEIGVGCGVVGVSCGLSETPGALHAASVELDSLSNATFLVNKDGSVPVTDYAQLTSGGTVSLGGASLTVNLGSTGSGGACTLELTAGEKLTLISTTGTLSGAFSNAPEGGEIPLNQLGLCSASTQKLRVEYHEEGSPETLTATVLESGSAPAASTFSALSTNATTARIEGQVFPASQSTTYHGAYGLASSESVLELRRQRITRPLDDSRHAAIHR